MPLLLPSSAPVFGSTLSFREPVTKWTSITNTTFHLASEAQASSSPHPIIAKVLDLPNGVSLTNEDRAVLLLGDQFDAHANMTLTLSASVTSALCVFSVTPLATNVSVNVTVSVEKSLNHPPFSGTAGGMMFCDGSDDFAYEMDFAMDSVTVDGRTGLGPGTVEFWAYAASPKSGESGDIGCRSRERMCERI